MLDKYPLAAANYTLNNTDLYQCGLPRDDAFHIWRDATTGDIPWPGAVFGLSTLGLFTWCQDQVNMYIFHSFYVFEEASWPKSIHLFFSRNEFLIEHFQQDTCFTVTI